MKEIKFLPEFQEWLCANSYDLVFGLVEPDKYGIDKFFSLPMAAQYGIWFEFFSVKNPRAADRMNQLMRNSIQNNLNIIEAMKGVVDIEINLYNERNN